MEKGEKRDRVCIVCWLVIRRKKKERKKNESEEGPSDCMSFSSFLAAKLKVTTDDNARTITLFFM